MDTIAWIELLGPTAIEGVILGVILALIWSMATNIFRLFLIGEIILFKWLESRDIIVVNWERLTLGLLENGTAAAQEALTLLESSIELSTYGLSIVLGFILVRKIKG